MTRAYVHALLPSLNSSMKLASIGDVVGAMEQDRSTAVAGTLGVRPRTVAMTVSLKREGAPDRRFTFAVADHPLLTPLLAYTALVGIVSEHERDLGPATYAVRGRASLAGHPAVEFEDVFTGDQPGLAAAAAIAMPVGALLTNGFEPVRVESLQIEMQGSERIRSATIERVWLGTTDLQPGASVAVKILLNPWRGDPFVQTIEVEVPRNAQGPLTLVVADGGALRAVGAARTARSGQADLRRSDDQVAERLAPRQPDLRPPRGTRHGHRRQRRGHAVAAILGAHRHAGRPRDGVQPHAAVFHPRRMGNPHGRGRGRPSDADTATGNTPPVIRRSKGTRVMNRRLLRPLFVSLLAAALVIAGLVVTDASTARFWRISTQADLLKGQSERLSIDYDGRLTLGPSARSVFAPTSPFVWCLAAGPDGSVYAGGGNDGLVWQVDRDGKSRVAFDAPELEVHALATMADGALLVATSPDGKVYRVAAGGSSTVFFDPEDKYIWALAVDAQGRVYVATGDKGVIYRVSADGKGDIFYKTQTTNVTSLLIGRDGQIIAGTESPGRVLEDHAGRQGVRACSNRPTAKFAACGWTAPARSTPPRSTANRARPSRPHPRPPRSRLARRRSPPSRPRSWP